MITRGRGKKGQVVNEPAQAPFKMNAEGELQLTEELAEALRHRELVWARIPPRSRKLLLPFLTVQETLRLDTAVAPGQEKERDHLEKAYRGLRSGGFDEHVFSSRNDYEGIKSSTSSKSCSTISTSTRCSSLVAVRAANFAASPSNSARTTYRSAI